MTCLCRFFVVTLLSAVAVTTWAAPSFLGPTGLLLVPTAEALANDQASVGAYLAEAESRLTYVVNYGVRQGVEVGFASLSDRATLINAKYAFQEEADDNIGLAVGIIDLTDQVNRTIYAVASKQFTITYRDRVFRGVGAHLGLAAGGGDDTRVPLDGFIGGLTLRVGDVVAISEFTGDNVNLGASLPLPGNVTGKIGWIHDVGTTIVGGLTYTHTF